MGATTGFIGYDHFKVYWVLLDPPDESCVAVASPGRRWQAGSHAAAPAAAAQPAVSAALLLPVFPAHQLHISQTVFSTTPLIHCPYTASQNGQSVQNACLTDCRPNLTKAQPPYSCQTSLLTCRELENGPLHPNDHLLFVHTYFLPFVHSIIQSLTHSVTHSTTHSLPHPLTLLLTYSLMYAPSQHVHLSHVCLHLTGHCPKAYKVCLSNHS